jgi:hypothetical protein
MTVEHHDFNRGRISDFGCRQMLPLCVRIFAGQLGVDRTLRRLDYRSVPGFSERPSREYVGDVLVKSVLRPAGTPE